jgi:iron complex transport system substrate-binding protein
MKYLPCVLLFLFFSCGEKRSAAPGQPVNIPGTAIRYAEGFRISNVGNARLVEVTYPYQGAKSGYRYLLVPRGETAPPHDGDIKVIYTPLKSIVCTSTTHVPLLDYLNQTDKLVGFPTTDYISSHRMRQRIDSGKVSELGVDKGMNLEVLAVLKPDVLMGYTMTSDFGQFKKVEELNIPVVINAEYLEKHPLGRAEWIKFMAAFFEQEKLADSVFNMIETNYLKVKNQVAAASHKPTVLSGIVYGDAWFMPGGQNYAATLLQDAGCEYLWSDNDNHGYLQLSFESVYEKANDADLWIGVGTLKNLKEIQLADHRYTRFRPFREKQIYNYDNRQGAKGGNEYLELGYLRPDLILMDLVKIGHPELLPDHALFFHRRLN